LEKIDIKKEIPQFGNLQLLAKQVVEGFISGIHKSPFHGFSSEFAEHRLYNSGESTKHIDWKLFARTDKLYTKRYEEETNMRCHFLVDVSSSMFYPKVNELNRTSLNKIGFSVLAAASIMEIVKKQRDAIGLSLYCDKLQFTVNEKGSERHYQMIYNELNEVLASKPQQEKTKTYTFLHQIAERLSRRSMLVIFTDMLQTEVEQEKIFEALRHLKYYKHQVVFFHVLDNTSEVNFDFEDAPKRFFDVESGEFIDLYASQLKYTYQKQMQQFMADLKLKCQQYKINYHQVDVAQPIDEVLRRFLAERTR
jgi:uncharacterized protein (DUF58 family)